MLANAFIVRTKFTCQAEKKMVVTIVLHDIPEPIN